ncbi:transposase [Pseudomonas zeae]
MSRESGAIQPAAMIRIDSIWLATELMDMRAGTETALARVIAVFGAAKPHCAYLFANRRANRMKVLVHNGVGIGWPLDA